MHIQIANERLQTLNSLSDDWNTSFLHDHTHSSLIFGLKTENLELTVKVHMRFRLECLWVTHRQTVRAHSISFLVSKHASQFDAFGLSDDWISVSTVLVTVRNSSAFRSTEIMTKRDYYGKQISGNVSFPWRQPSVGVRTILPAISVVLVGHLSVFSVDKHSRPSPEHADT